MSLHFIGGERLQKGRGIGGIFRLAKSLFSPLIKTAAKSAITAAKSTTGRAVLKAAKKQAVKSASNIAKDLISGENLKDTLTNEIKQVKRNAGKTVNKIGVEHLNRSIAKKRKNKIKNKTVYKKRKRDLFDE